LAQVLIEKQLLALHEEFTNLLKAEKNEDMGTMYDLLARIGDAFGNMREILQNHIATQGRTAIHENKDQCVNVIKIYLLIMPFPILKSQ